MVLIFQAAFTQLDSKYIDGYDPISPPQRELNFKFYRPMVDLDKVDWIQWFGPTVFSYEEGDFWDYTDYCQGQHCGIDLGADWGTPIYAGSFGIVKQMNNQIVEVWYAHTTGHGWWKVLFMNFANIYVVKEQFVTPNTILGTVGNHVNYPNAGGIFADHLHLEVRYDPSPTQYFKSENHNPLSYFYDKNIYEKLNKIASKQYASNDWYYMRDVILMGIDYPQESQIVYTGYGSVEKSWISWMGFRTDYVNKDYYIETYPRSTIAP